MAAPRVTAQWNEQFTTRTPEAAWAIEWLNPDSDDPPTFVALVQIPGVRADTAGVRDDLVARAVTAKLNGEQPIAPPAGPIEERDWRVAPAPAR